MSRVCNALVSGLAVGFGIGSALTEFWFLSAGCFVVSGIAQFFFMRSCLRRIY